MSKGYRPAPGRPPPPPSTAVSLEPVETPKPIAVSVDIPLKPDEGVENNKAKPIRPEEVKEGIEVPLRLEEEPGEMDKVVEEIKIGQGPKGLMGAYGSVHPSRRPSTYLGPVDLRWNR
jgi:hypothetical protein